MTTPAGGLIDTLRVGLAARYVIERELGAGGMATVYLAEDVRHKRRVAIKVLRSDVTAVLGAERFLREIEVTAALQHPNIVPLYDSGLVGDVPYYVTPFVAGESLRDRIRRDRQLPLEVTLVIVRGVAAALQFAHERGVVHRDIKPDNVLLHEGQPLVADFGIARAMTTTAGTSLTETGIVLGTPQYMSPEQALGERVDLRADIYALAALTYEMLGGEPPFTGATTGAILNRQMIGRPLSLHVIRDGLPPAIDGVLTRALSAAPADRFASASDFVAALDAAVSARRPTSRRWIGVVVAFVAAVALAAVAWLARDRGNGVTPAGSIAVLPFVNASSDSAVQYFGDGVAEELIVGLSRVPGLRVSPRSSTFGLRGQDGGVSAIGRRLGVARVLEGTVRKSGSKLRVTAQLTDVSGGFSPWTETFDREDGDALALQEELARAILSRLAPTLTGAGAAPVLQHGTRDPAAWDLYLQGRYFFGLRSGPGFVRAGELFERAIVRDSTFARAWAGLADSYCIQANFGVRSARDVCPRSLAAAQRALALDSTLAEAHASLGFVHLFYEWDLERAAVELGRALTLDPLSANTKIWMMHVESTRGDTAAALALMRRAVIIEPFSLIARTRLGSALMRAGRSSEALDEARAVVAIDSTYGEGWRSLGLFNLAAGRSDSALAIFRRHDVPAGLRAYAAASAGKQAEARRIIGAIERDPVARRAQALFAAFTSVALGDNDLAFRWLQRAAVERTPDLVFAWTDPYLAPLRADPRFGRWADSVGVPRPRR